ncbi:Uncharacterised protein [Raoultella planticola]|uniref:hypothetical protein n=1 Tax=Raoultella planticola TaxID=575 RepID=UPI000D843385|nr:hypothetical protein [Raoultella planticola]SPZ32238.1 Uncharacterised protein [Raoultella planticola]
MNKSTITRERLQEIAEDGFLKHGESKELARMALAAMDSEPVYINQDGYQAIQDILASRMSGTGRYITLHRCSGHPVEKRYPLYLAPQPAPVVPDEVTAEDCPAFVKYEVTEVYEAWSRGFNACRAAMLNGGKS